MNQSELQNVLTVALGHGSARVAMSIVGPILRANDVQISQLHRLTEAEITRQDERIADIIKNISDEQTKREMAETRAGELEDRVSDLDNAANVERLRTDAAVSRLAELENATTWFTTCTNCARILDSSIRDYERAERATDEITKLLNDLRTEITARRRAEATIDRVKTLRNGFLSKDEIKWDKIARRISDALKPPREHFAGPGGNAEDCQRCAERQDLVYPFICQCTDELDDEGRLV